MKNNHPTKSVAYAYPTSPIAKQLGRMVAGCFYVVVGCKLSKPFDTKDEAMVHALNLPQVFDKYSLR